MPRDDKGSQGKAWKSKEVKRVQLNYGSQVRLNEVKVGIVNRLDAS